MSKKTSVTEKTFDIVNCKSYLVGDLRKLYAQLYDVSISKAQKVPKDDLCSETVKFSSKSLEDFLGIGESNFFFSDDFFLGDFFFTT